MGWPDGFVYIYIYMRVAGLYTLIIDFYGFLIMGEPVDTEIICPATEPAVRYLELITARLIIRAYKVKLKMMRVQM